MKGRIIEGLPSPFEVFAVMVGAGLGMYYASGELVFINPNPSDSLVVAVGSACMITALLAVGVEYLRQQRGP